MKTLYLVRHAKSSWGAPGLADHERPLNARGERDAPMMGARLADKHPRPQHIVSSPAVRALSTAHILARSVLIPQQDVAVEPGIYDAGVQRLLEVIRGLNDAHQAVLLTGHNPGFTDLLNSLAAGDIGHMPTCAIAQLQYPGNAWAEVGPDTCTLVDYDFPKRGAPSP